ncbi:pyridoxal phosphate-dependent aminotransferase [Leptospira interrogans]
MILAFNQPVGQMQDFEKRNQHFDRLVNTPGLRWLGQNTNHYPVHPDVRAAMIQCINDEEFHAYAPPLGFEKLRALVAADLGLDGMVPVITDGAVAGLYHVCRTLCGPGDEFLTTDPTWAWPMSFARAVGADVVQIPIYGAEYGYRLNPERLAAAVTPKTKVIYIVDPNNPLGTVCTKDEIIAITDIARKAGAYLIHDCTYRDFAYDHTLAAAYYPERTITVWSFSKWLGFAGLRVGAIIANPELMGQLTNAPPNNLGSNVVAQRGAIAGLEVKQKWFPGVLESQRRNQAMVRDAALSIPGLEMPVFPSNGNFLVIETEKAGVRPEAICAVMAKHNILVRQGSYHTKAFGDRFIKVSVSVPENWVEEFCALLPQAVEEARGINEPLQLF